MGKIKLTYMSEGVDQIKKDYETIKKEGKIISESPTKITIRSQGVKEAIDAFGRLKVEIPKLEQIYSSLQDKSSDVAKSMLKDIKELTKAYNEFNNAVNTEGKVSSAVSNGAKSSNQLNATLNKEKQVTEELEKQKRIIEEQQRVRLGQEKELNTLRERLQSISRTISDQQNALATGKKGKTPMDIANLLQQLEQGKMRAEELAQALGEDNEAVQHFRNGMDWTEANNPLRAMRDEAYKLIPEMSKLKQEIEKLKVSGGNENLLGFDEKRLDKLQARFSDIKATLQNTADKLGKDSYYGKFIDEIQQTINLLQQQYDKEAELKVQRQQAVNEDSEIAQKEKEYLSLLKEKFQLENQILNLSKDEQSTNKNQSQIQEYQRQIELIEQKLSEIKNETKFTDETKNAIDKVTQAHINEQNVIKAKNQDIRNTNEEKMRQQSYEQKEKEYLSLLKQKFELETKIANLSKDKKTREQNQNQINEYQKQIKLINQKLQGIRTGVKLTEETKKKENELTQAHRNELNVIKAKNEDLKNQQGLLSDTIKNFAKFTLYYQTLNMLRQGIQKALETMKELDAAFTDIRIVTGDSVEETNQLAKEYNQLAKEIGSTTADVAAGAGEWLRQGRTAEETTELLKASMTLSKVGAIESSEATELLTSSLNGYQIAAKDAMSIVDKMSAVDLAAATSTKELATALARTANIANDSNVSFDKLIAMIGTVSSVTRRSAETIRRII